MCDCDMYQVYESCECPKAREAETKAFQKMLLQGYSELRHERELDLEEHDRTLEENDTKHAKEVEALHKRMLQNRMRHKKKVQELKREIGKLKKAAELNDLASQGQEAKIKALMVQLEKQNAMHQKELSNLRDDLSELRKKHEAELDEKDAAMAGSREMLRQINLSTMRQVQISRAENDRLKKALAEGVFAERGDPNVQVMSKCELKQEISKLRQLNAQLKMEKKEMMGELDNKERMLNTAQMAIEFLQTSKKR